MYEEFIAERLMRLRTAKGVSAREMSLDIGQNCSYINRIENRKAMPSMLGFFYICEYLGVTPGEFFADNAFSDGRSLILAKEIDLLTPSQKDIVMGIIEELKKSGK